TIAFDAIETADTLEIHDTGRPGGVLLHRGQQILTTRDRPWCFINISRRSRIGQRLHSFIHTRWVGPFKGLHAVFLSFRRIRILSGVIGRSLIRTPIALKTALASAPTAGMIDGSPTPITASRLSSSSMSATISGISSEPGS